MLTLLLIVGPIKAMTAATGAYQDYLTLGTSSYMQFLPDEGEGPIQIDPSLYPVVIYSASEFRISLLFGGEYIDTKEGWNLIVKLYIGFLEE